MTKKEISKLLEDMDNTTEIVIGKNNGGIKKVMDFIKVKVHPKAKSQIILYP